MRTTTVPHDGARLNAESLAIRLGGAQIHDDGTFRACCPAHEDRQSSLLLTDNNDAVDARCLAGCDDQAVRAALVSKGDRDAVLFSRVSFAESLSACGSLLCPYCYPSNVAAGSSWRDDTEREAVQAALRQHKLWRESLSEPAVWPPMLVIPEKKRRGAVSRVDGRWLGENKKPVPKYPLFPYERVCEPFATDAYMVGYALRDEPEAPSPRLTKAMADYAVTRYAIVDVDLENHAPWPGDVAQHGRELEQSLASNEVTAQAAWMMTKGGYRLVWPLAEPLDPRDYEDLMHRLFAALDDTLTIGKVDRSCKDWTRLMRVPCGTRDGQRVDLPRDCKGRG